MSQLLLDVKGLTMQFGGLVAVNKVNLSVKNRQIVSVIAPTVRVKPLCSTACLGFISQPQAALSLKEKKSQVLKTSRSPAKA